MKHLLLLLLLSHFKLNAQAIGNYKPHFELDSLCDKNIHTALENNIDWGSEIMDVKGAVVAMFFVTPAANIIDISMLTGINEAFDNAFKKAILTIDPNEVQCAVDPNEVQQVLLFVKFH